ncbi:MAG: phospholipase [Microbacterium sp.]|nr:phospholipase [Microbacterium sp.]MBA4345713.1 phospholipase [Microbacterium sp.]
MSGMQLIDPSAIIWSAPEAERAGRPLLVLLHGYGSHEGDLFGLSPHLPLQPVIASVRAPLRAGPGYAWYGLEGATPESRSEGADAAARGLLHWLDGVQASSVGLLGFSQGGAMSIHLLRHAPERFDFAVSLAGFVVQGDAPADARLAALAPPVFWGRGTHDAVIPPAFVDHTQSWLPKHSTLTERIYEGLGHSVSEAELADVLTFLRAQYS